MRTRAEEKNIYKLNKMVLFRLIMLLLAGRRFRCNFLDALSNDTVTLVFDRVFARPNVQTMLMRSLLNFNLRSMLTFKRSTERKTKKQRLWQPVRRNGEKLLWPSADVSSYLHLASIQI